MTKRKRNFKVMLFNVSCEKTTYLLSATSCSDAANQMLKVLYALELVPSESIYYLNKWFVHLNLYPQYAKGWWQQRRIRVSGKSPSMKVIDLAYKKKMHTKP